MKVKTTVKRVTDNSKREPIIEISDSMKRDLRMIYKQWKVGMLSESDLSPRVKHLLIRYYGVNFNRKRT